MLIGQGMEMPGEVQASEDKEEEREGQVQAWDTWMWCGAEFLSKIRCFPSICPGLTLVLT